MVFLKTVISIFVIRILDSHIVQRNFVQSRRIMIDMDAPYQILLKIANGTKNVHTRSVKRTRRAKIIQFVPLSFARKTRMRFSVLLQ